MGCIINHKCGHRALIQDSVWADLFVRAEAEHHDCLASRPLVHFATGRMIGPLRLKSFHDDVYKGLVRSTFAPRKDMMDKNDPLEPSSFTRAQGVCLRM